MRRLFFDEVYYLPEIFPNIVACVEFTVMDDIAWFYSGVAVAF